MRVELRTHVVLNTESSFVQVPFVFRVEEGVGGIRHVMKLFSFPFFVLIYSDELINPSLSCHKMPLSEWTYSTKASDAKR